MSDLDKHILDTLSILDHRLATDGSFNEFDEREDARLHRRIFVSLAFDDADWLPGGERRIYPVREKLGAGSWNAPAAIGLSPMMAVVEVREWNVRFAECRMMRRVEIIPTLVESGTIVTCAIGFTTLPIVVTKKWRCMVHTECVKSIEMGEECMRAQRAASL